MSKTSDFTLPLDAMAKLLDITPRRVQQLAKEGVIPTPTKGKYELVGSVQGYVKYLRARSVGIELGSEAFTSARARATGLRADIAQVELDRLRGQYVHVEEVKMAWLAIVQTVRTRLLGIPSKISARIITIKNPVAAQGLLREEISEALSELSQFSVTAMQAAGGGSGGDGDAVARATAAADNI